MASHDGIADSARLVTTILNPMQKGISLLKEVPAPLPLNHAPIQRLLDSQNTVAPWASDWTLLFRHAQTPHHRTARRCCCCLREL